MKKKAHITYCQLLEIVSWGIFSMKMRGISVSDERLKKCPKIKNAMYEGIYTGSPGRDIYFMLPYLDKNQMQEVAIKLAQQFPYVPPKNHSNISSCIRFIYGQFEKQGVLRSEKDFKRMKKEKNDWSLSRVFLKLLYNELQKNKNYYALTILSEMEGHRLGDEAVLNDDLSNLAEMEKLYLRGVKYAYKCKSYKHMFSLYYWSSRYFMYFTDKNKIIKYCKLTIKYAGKYYHKYFLKGENYYSKRFIYCIDYIKENDNSSWSTFYYKYMVNIKSDSLRRVFKKQKK